MSQITTHVLDTSKGKPARGIRIVLYSGSNDEWTEIARGITDTDGRATGLLEKDKLLPHGIYKLRLESKDYFDMQQIPTFYPFVEIVFDINSDEHFHIPLLLSPYGFSTYRGS